MEREELKKMLDDYYGDCRNDNHKQEIVDLIDSHIFEIIEIYHKNGYEF